MDQKERDFLRSQRRKICLIHFNARDIAEKLLEFKLFREEDKNKIILEEKDLRQKEILLDTLPRRGPKAFSEFTRAAEELKINDLYKMLTGKDISLKSPTTDDEEKSGNEQELDILDGPPTSASGKDEKQKKVPEAEDIDISAEDGRPGIFGSNKKKTKVDTTASSSMPLNLPTETSFSLKDCYNMEYTPRGYFLLINNKNFLPESGMDKYPRNGTDVDGEAIMKLFHEMGFIVDDYYDQSVYNMRKYIKQAGSRDYTREGCFALCILSHGQEGVLYGTDGTMDIREITSYFHGSNLAGKPKLFFFQACQGSEYMDGVVPDDGVMETDGPEEANNISLPNEADFLYAYSTVPGYYSWRNSARGSWFIQAICKVFREHAHTMDVLRMLTRVNRIVSTKKSQTGQRASHHKRQISSIVSQLRNELYFFPPHGPLKVYDGDI